MVQGTDDGFVPPRRRQETLWTTLRRFSRLWGFLLFLVFVLVLFRSVVLPFVFAVAIAYLLSPVVTRLQPKITRVGGVIAVYLVIVASLGVFFGLLLPAVVKDLTRLQDAAPRIITTINDEWIPYVSGYIEGKFGELWAHEVTHAGERANELVFTPRDDGSWVVNLDGVDLMVEEASDGRYLIGPAEAQEADIGEQIRHLLATKGAQLTTAVGPAIQGFLTGVTRFLTKFVVTFMIAAFLLIDLDRVNRFVRSLVPVEYRSNFDDLVVGLDRGLAGVVRGQLLICVVNGVLTYIGLVVFGIKYSLLLAVFAAILSLIPIFGTIISSIPIVGVALVSQEGSFSFVPAVAIMAWIVGIHLLEANVLNPKIIGDSAHIHPVVVVFALLAGEHVYGLVGALLAVPVASMVQTVFLYLRDGALAMTRAGEDAPP